MRLPAVTPEQIKHEASRAFHETLWEGHQDGRAVIVVTTPADAQRQLLTLSGRLRKFWAARGFRVRCQQVLDRRGIRVWLEVSKTADQRCA